MFSLIQKICKLQYINDIINNVLFIEYNLKVISGIVVHRILKNVKIKSLLDKFLYIFKYLRLKNIVLIS